jgi:hypothetical protein
MSVVRGDGDYLTLPGVTHPGSFLRPVVRGSALLVTGRSGSMMGLHSPSATCSVLA